MTTQTRAPRKTSDLREYRLKEARALRRRVAVTITSQLPFLRQNAGQPDVDAEIARLEAVLALLIDAPPEP